MKKLMLGLMFGVMLLLSGCTLVPMGDAGEDAALKTFTTKSGVAGLYIYRNEYIGAAVRMGVEIDGKPFGKTAARTYLYTELTPGKHVVTSKSENDFSLELEAEPGKLYYLWQEIKVGVFWPRTKLHLVDEEQGRAGVLETRLAVPASAESQEAQPQAPD
jgi:hypothetical protein